MKRANFRDPSTFVNPSITLCYFILVVFLYDGLAHFVVGVTVAIPIIWFYTSDVMKRPTIDLLPLWFLLSIWLCVGEFEDVIIQSSSRISVRDFLWMIMIILSFVDKVVQANPDIFRVGCSVLLASGIALATTDSLARRLTSFSMSYKVSCCILLYTAYEIRCSVRREKQRNITKFNLFQSAWVLFAWNALVIIAVPQIIYLVFDIIYFNPTIDFKPNPPKPIPPNDFTETKPPVNTHPFPPPLMFPMNGAGNIQFSSNMSPKSIQPTPNNNNLPAPYFSNFTTRFPPTDQMFNPRAGMVRYKIIDNDDD